MASFTDWILRLGVAGATRNAAAVRAERRAAEARAEALIRRFTTTSPAVARRERGTA